MFYLLRYNPLKDWDKPYLLCKLAHKDVYGPYTAADFSAIGRSYSHRSIRSRLLAEAVKGSCVIPEDLGMPLERAVLVNRHGKPAKTLAGIIIESRNAAEDIKLRKAALAIMDAVLTQLPVEQAASATK